MTTLSRSQQAVVDAGTEPLLVIAGPGAGKTTVLAARIERLLKSSPGSARKILGITYTNVAAKNLRTRIEAADVDASQRVVITTFHGFATRILQQHGSHIGLQSNFSIINEIEDRVELLERAAMKAGIGSEALSGRAEQTLRLLGRLYERCLTFNEARELLLGDSALGLVQQLFDAYIEQSIDEAQLEFSLLVNLCNRLLLQFSPVAQQTRAIYQHICVDEFQDTNEMQYRLLEIIANTNAEGLVLLADQDQVIYQWNGASPSRLSEAQKRFGMTVLLLPTSYRCPDDIVAAASRLIAHNSTRFVTPTYDSERHGASRLQIKQFEDGRNEAEWVASELSELTVDQLEQTVVLARNRRILDLTLTAASKRGVPCLAPIAKYDFVSAPLVMLQSLLRLASQPTRQVVLRRLITSFYIMTGRELDAEVLAAKAEEDGVDVLSTFFNDLLLYAKSSEFKDLANVVSESLVAKKDFRGVSKALFSWVDALPTSNLKVAYHDDYDAERRSWEELERRHQGLQSDRVSLADFLRQVDLESKTKEPTGPVRFLTVHGAKGLEFRKVFLVGAAEGQFPAYQAVMAGADSHALEEERRSFFVAITRSMSELTITYASRYFGRPSSISRFVTEMGTNSLGDSGWQP